MNQKMAQMLKPAEVIALHHNLSTGEALDVLIRLVDLIDRGIPMNDIIARLDLPK